MRRRHLASVDLNLDERVLHSRRLDADVPVCAGRIRADVGGEQESLAVPPSRSPLASARPWHACSCPTGCRATGRKSPSQDALPRTVPILLKPKSEKTPLRLRATGSMSVISPNQWRHASEMAARPAKSREARKPRGEAC